MEKLIEIRKVTQNEINEIVGRSKFNNYIGYTIVTSERKIICILDNEASCCENWDVEYEIYDADLQLLGYKEIKIKVDADEIDEDYDEGSAVIVEVLEVDKKHLIKLWNSHNGYYAHDYYIYDTSGKLTTNGLI